MMLATVSKIFSILYGEIPSLKNLFVHSGSIPSGKSKSYFSYGVRKPVDTIISIPTKGFKNFRFLTIEKKHSSHLRSLDFESKTAPSHLRSPDFESKAAPSHLRSLDFESKTAPSQSEKFDFRMIYAF